MGLRRATLVTGVYGVGKTEFCIQYALRLQKACRETVFLADLDILNPYFRSREKAEDMKKLGVILMGNVSENNPGSDVPALSFGFMSHARANRPIILDLAGSERGLTVLAGVREELEGAEFWCVMNKNRPECDCVEKMVQFVRVAETVSKLSITGLVHNTHLVRSTEAADVLAGQVMVEEAAKVLGLPIRFTMLEQKIYEEIGAQISNEVLVFESLRMREIWL